MSESKYLTGYKQADADNSAARAALLEAISEARREAADIHNHESTRAYWQQKAKRWQDNLAQTRAQALNRAMNESDATSLRVVLTGDGEWRGTFAEFLDSNPDIEPGLAAAILSTLQRGEPWQTGGGAALLQSLFRECDFSLEVSR